MAQSTQAPPAVDVEVQVLSAERLTFFSDAVVAIAITVLALDLPVPKPDGSTNHAFWAALVRERTDYIAFMISFAVIGSHWLGHHRVFSRVARLGGRLASWNMVWLLMIVLTPFATRILVGADAFAARFAVYAGVQALASLSMLLAVFEMDRHDLTRPGTERAMFTRSYWRLSIMAALFLVSIPLAAVTSWAYLCWVAVPLVWRVRGLVERLHRPRY